MESAIPQTSPAFVIPGAGNSVPVLDNAQNSPSNEFGKHQLSYFPIARGLAYNIAVNAFNTLPGAEFGKYTKPPRQPLLIAGEFIDGTGYLRLRAHDGTLISPVDMNRHCWAVYYPAPYSMHVQALLSYFDSALKPFTGYRDIILQYQSLSDKRLFLEYSTGSALVQGDLSLIFIEAPLRYVGCKIGRGVDWWM